MSIDDELAALLRAPQTFLENNAVIIYGSNTSASGEKDFVMQATADHSWSSVVGGHRRNVPLYVLYDASTFNGKGDGPQSASFRVHYVSMRTRGANGDWEDSDITHYALPPDGTEIMVTSKLNGCTFGIGSNGGGARLVSHLKPPESGASGRIALDRATRAGFAEGRLDVSVMSSAGQNGTVLAIRQGNSWTFFVQRFQIIGLSGVVDSVVRYT